MIKNIAIGILVVAVLVLGYFIAFGHHSVPAQTEVPVTATSVPGTASATNAATSSSAQSSSSVAVSGMVKYTDASFGFSFWYPAAWQLIPSPKNLAFGARLQSATVVGQFALQIPGASSPDILIQEARSTSRTIVDTGGVGPIGPITYFFNPTTHLWMVTTSEDGVTKAADISNNTMGGLHVFAGTSRFGTQIVPLSADNFVVIGNSGGIDSSPLTQTVVALDPAVATPVSAAQQVQTIQAEMTAYASTTNQQSTSPSWQTYTDSATGITIQYASLNGISMQPSIMITPAASIDTNGCTPGDGSASNDTTLVVNGIHFCKSIQDDSGMSHTGSTYIYTFFKNGNYYALYYSAAELSCAVYDTSDPQYQSCENNGSTTDSLVQYIQQSLSTLSF